MRPKLDSDFKKNFTGEQGYSRNLMTLKMIDTYADVFTKMDNSAVDKFDACHTLRVV